MLLNTFFALVCPCRHGSLAGSTWATSAMFLLMIATDRTLPTVPELMADGGKLLVTLALREMPYAEYLRTNHWQAVRAAALKRAGYQCALCKAAFKLEVHHLSYANRGNEKAEELVVLCNEHHKAQEDAIRAVIHAQFVEQFAEGESNGMA